MFHAHLLTEEEKAAVDMVFHNAIEALSEEDRKLPQVSQGNDYSMWM